MTPYLTALAARLLSLLLPPVLLPPVSLWGLLGAVTVLGIAGPGRLLYGCPGLPGEASEDTEGGQAP